jgi:biopolymer transport protein TolR
MLKRSRRHRRRPMSDINVVPYIDVMLVLLVIFMVTAPLITQGINVNLPKARTGPITSPTKDSVVITVDQNGDYYIDVGKDKGVPIRLKALAERIHTVLEYNPGTPVLVRADYQVPYEKVLLAMAAAQRGGAENVGLIVAAPPHIEP